MSLQLWCLLACASALVPGIAPRQTRVLAAVAEPPPAEAGPKWATKKTLADEMGGMADAGAGAVGLTGTIQVVFKQGIAVPCLSLSLSLSLSQNCESALSFPSSVMMLARSRAPARRREDYGRETCVCACACACDRTWCPPRAQAIPRSRRWPSRGNLSLKWPLKRTSASAGSYLTYFMLRRGKHRRTFYSFLFGSASTVEARRRIVGSSNTSAARESAARARSWSTASGFARASLPSPSRARAASRGGGGDNARTRADIRSKRRGPPMHSSLHAEPRSRVPLLLSRRVGARRRDVRDHRAPEHDCDQEVVLVLQCQVLFRRLQKQRPRCRPCVADHVSRTPTRQTQRNLFGALRNSS